MIKKDKRIIFDILAIILIAIFAVSISPKTMQNDTYYTVSVGKIISENGIDMKDHFSWHEDLSYTYPHWLYDLLMYKIYNLGGWTGIYISTCILAAILGICIYKVNSKLTDNQLISFMVTIGSLYLIQSYIAARAQLVTFILFILLIYNIERYLKKKKIINAVTIIVIQVLIANLHVAVWPFTLVVYLPYIAEYLICEISEILLYDKIKILKLKRKIKNTNKKINKNKENVDLINKKEVLEQRLDIVEKRVEKIKEKRAENLKNPYKIKMEKNNNARWLILIMVISIFTGLCTPLGKVPYIYTYLTYLGNTTEHINEHLPMTLIENIKILSTLIILISILTFTKAKIKLSDLFMIGGLTYLMLASRRQSSMFALIGTLTLTRIVTDMIKIYIGKDGKDLIKSYASKVLFYIIAIVVIIMSANNFKSKVKNPYVSKNSYPVEAAEWILENLDIKKIKLYNEYNYGSYLLYKGIPVFIDSRADLYAPEFNTKTDNAIDGRDIFSDFINSSNIGTYYGNILKKYEITHIIIKKNSKMNMLIKNADIEKYNLLYSDDNFVIYEVLEY